MDILIHLTYLKFFISFKLVSYKKMGIGDWGLGPIPNPQSPIMNSIFEI